MNTRRRRLYGWYYRPRFRTYDGSWNPTGYSTARQYSGQIPTHWRRLP